MWRQSEKGRRWVAGAWQKAVRWGCWCLAPALPPPVAPGQTHWRSPRHSGRRLNRAGWFAQCPPNSQARTCQSRRWCSGQGSFRMFQRGMGGSLQWRFPEWRRCTSQQGRHTEWCLKSRRYTNVLPSRGLARLRHQHMHRLQDKECQCRRCLKLDSIGQAQQCNCCRLRLCKIGQRHRGRRPRKPRYKREEKEAQGAG